MRCRGKRRSRSSEDAWKERRKRAASAAAGMKSSKTEKKVCGGESEAKRGKR